MIASPQSVNLGNLITVMYNKFKYVYNTTQKSVAKRKLYTTIRCSFYVFNYKQ